MTIAKTENGPSGEDGLAASSRPAVAANGTTPAQTADPWGFNALEYAQRSYRESQSWMDSSLRTQWEANLRSFRSAHPKGSKYYADAYKGRSNLFRPRTRSMVRKGEAQAALAYFANSQIAAIKAADSSSKSAEAAAELIGHLLQIRMTSQSPTSGIPWYVTAVGAYQSAQTMGVAISKQWWQYETRTVEGETYVMYDRPCCDLIEPENILVSRAANWRDPINSSPFLIYRQPMMLGDILDRMDDQGIDGIRYLRVPASDLLKSKTGDFDSTRRARESNQREDTKENTTAVEDYRTIWVHENFMRHRGIDYVYLTAGEQTLLTSPVPVQKRYPHCPYGERPFVMGFAILEAFRIYPSAKVELTEQLQREANDVVNQRIDNVRLAMNKRYQVRRGAQVDLRSLTRSVPGAITLVSDTEKDVKEMEAKDVTASSYREQDRINADFDDIGGDFNPGTVQTNRAMNETVGLAKMMQGGAAVVAEYDIRTFTETWTEPVLRQIVRMIQTYESDSSILRRAAANSQKLGKFGLRVNEMLITSDLEVKIDAGLGATDPGEKLQRFSIAAKTAKELYGEQIGALLDPHEGLKEIFGSLGYRDGSRFFRFEGQDPMVLMLLEEMKRMQEEIDKRLLDKETKVEVARLGAMSRVLGQIMEKQGGLDQASQDFLHLLTREREKRAADAQMASNQHASEMAKTRTQLDGQFRQAMAIAQMAPEKESSSERK